MSLKTKTMKMEQTAKNILKLALDRAKELNHSEISPYHIMLAVCDMDNNAKKLLIDRGVNVDDVGVKMVEYLGTTIGRNVNGIPNSNVTKLSKDTKNIIQDAERIAKEMNHNTVQSEHILLSLMENNAYIGFVLNKVNQNELKETIKNTILMSNNGFDGATDEEIPGNERTKVKTGEKSKTPILDNFSIDLCQAARDGKIDPIVGRKVEIERVAQILSRRRKNNPVLVGEPGCVLPETMIKIRKVSDKKTHTIHKIITK